MASEEKQSEEDAENPRIECKSKRSINILLQTLKDQFLKHNNIDTLSDKTDQESLNRKLFQIYKRAFLSNILVDGQTVSDTEDEDMTSEFEPYDTEKENYIQHELMNKFDEQLVTTTRLRKTGPHIIRSHMKKTIRPELKYLALVNVTPECRDMEVEVEMDVGVSTVKEDIETRLHGTAQTLEATKQDCEEMVVKSKDLLQALKLYVKTEKSNIHQVMSETPPSTPVTKPGHQNTSIKCEISKKLLL